jgi:DNA-binding transcriptional LysR family regulator
MAIIPNMLETDLARVDLNLLVVLDALLDTGSVTTAARRLGLSQPAASRALARLRALLGDRLLVRGPGGRLIATPRADGLREPLARALAAVRGVLAAAPFEPATARGRLRVTALELEVLATVPALLARLERAAPGLDVEVRRGWGEPFRDLAEGRLDLVIGVVPDAPAGLRRQRLIEDSLVCLVRAGHPAVAAGLDLHRFLALRHVLVTTTGEGIGPVDAALAGRGLARRIVLRLPYFLVAPPVVARSDLIVTLPRRLARLAAASLPVVALEPPLPLPSFAIDQLWHERRQDDPAHAWLRREVAAAAREGEPC